MSECKHRLSEHYEALDHGEVCAACLKCELKKLRDINRQLLDALTKIKEIERKNYVDFHSSQIVGICIGADI